MKIGLLAALILVLNSPVFSQWVSDPTLNTPICTDYHNQAVVLGVSDGAGGMIMTWRDQEMSWGYDVYAQRINSEGMVQWDLRGAPIVVANDVQLATGIVSDGNGGAYIGWHDLRANTRSPFDLPDSSDAYLQHINPNGEILWGENGMSVSPQDTSREYDPYLVEDGTGGLLVFWGADTTAPNGSYITNIYGQHYNSEGEKLWSDHSALIDSGYGGSDTNPSYRLKVDSDCSGGAFVYVASQGNGLNKILRVSSEGEVLWTIPTPHATQFTSDNNGGVIFTYETSVYEDTAWVYSHHAQWLDSMGEPLWGEEGTIVYVTSQDNRDPEILSDNHGGLFTFFNTPFAADVYCQRIGSGGVIVWENPLQIASGGLYAIYNMKCDSNGNVTVVFGDFNSHSGSQHIKAQRVTLEGDKLWGEEGAIISARESEKGFSVPIVHGVEDGNIIVWTNLHPWDGWDLYGQYVNQYGNIGPTSISSEQSELPVQSILMRAYPNPFNPRATIVYDIPVQSEVLLTIYDISGREIKTLVDMFQPSGHYEILWDAKITSGKLVSSGTYFLKLQAGHHFQTMKLVYLR